MLYFFKKPFWYLNAVHGSTVGTAGVTKMKICDNFFIYGLFQ